MHLSSLATCFYVSDRREVRVERYLDIPIMRCAALGRRMPVSKPHVMAHIVPELSMRLGVFSLLRAYQLRPQ